MKDSTVVALAAIAGLVVLGTACVLKGVNHTLIFSIAVIVGGIGGYELKARRG